MNENADKYLDELSQKLMNKSSVEQPSLDFTQKVMSQIEDVKISSVTTYVPLISKRIWFVIVILLVAISSYLAFFGTFNNDNTWISQLRFDRLSEYSIPNPMANVEFSQTLFYAFLLFAIMMCVQIPILKHYFDKRFEA